MNAQSINVHSVDTVVVGGGIAGLTAAAYLAKAGQRVTLLEKSQQLGGMGITREEQGFLLNMGAHALYRGGEGFEVLQELGVSVTGSPPALTGYGWYKGELALLPTTPKALMGKSVLTAEGKRGFLGLVTKLFLIDTDKLRDVSVGTWINQNFHDESLRHILHMLTRLTTYVNAPKRLSAAVFIKQFQRAITKNVLYLDGGWQTIINGLCDVATRHGLDIRTGARVTAIEASSSGYTISTAGGDSVYAANVILAVPAAVAKALLPQSKALQKSVANQKTVYASTLDVALTHLPNPDVTFVMGLDEPVYLQVHSKYAQLTPEGHALIHTLYYRPQEETRSDEEIKTIMEKLLDQAQPGWREAIITTQHLPHITVMSGFPQINLPTVPMALNDAPGIYLAGDWVGDEVLADSSFATGKAAAKTILEQARVYA